MTRQMLYKRPKTPCRLVRKSALPPPIATGTTSKSQRYSSLQYRLNPPFIYSLSSTDSSIMSFTDSLQDAVATRFPELNPHITVPVVHTPHPATVSQTITHSEQLSYPFMALSNGLQSQGAAGQEFNAHVAQPAVCTPRPTSKGQGHWIWRAFDCFMSLGETSDPVVVKEDASSLELPPTRHSRDPVAVVPRFANGPIQQYPELSLSPS